MGLRHARIGQDFWVAFLICRSREPGAGEASAAGDQDIVDDVLVSLDAEFESLYEGSGRSSIAPERLLRASLLQAFYSVRSERQLMGRSTTIYWFVGLGIDDAVWDHSTFSKNRDRLLDADVAAKIKGSAIDGRTTRHEGYKVSQRKRKLVEEVFGWGKTIAGMAKVTVRGLRSVRYAFTFALADYNLIRMPRLLAAA